GSRGPADPGAHQMPCRHCSLHLPGGPPAAGRAGTPRLTPPRWGRSHHRWSCPTSLEAEHHMPVDFPADTTHTATSDPHLDRADDLQAVLWDFDGTLADSEVMWMKAEYELIPQLGGEWNDEHAHNL